MDSSIKNMPSDARLWVYQSNRALTENEVASIQLSGAKFIDEWAAHGASLKASLEVKYNRFIVIAVDEKQAMASGCSIDKSVQFIKELESQLNLNLFDRLQVAFREGDAIRSCSLSEFEQLAAQKKVDKGTIVFNNMVASKSAFDTEWEVPLENSWQSRVLTS